MINPLWNKWIFASIVVHFSTKCTANGIHLFVEGFPLDTTNEKTWAELRMDGPSIKEVIKGQFFAEMEVNVLVSSAKNQNNVYTHQENQGLIQSFFENTIPVYKMGEVTEDQVTCLHLTSRDRVIVSNFGQVNATTLFEQSSVEGKYRCRLAE